MITMILADKLIKLRKQFGWSQEDLAEKMNVSRQSVSKWESASSIPDLNKIIKLADIFNVSTDYLLRDEVDETEQLTEDKDPLLKQVSLEEANDYVEKKQRTIKSVAKGVMLCIFAVIPLFFFLALAESGTLPENIAVIFGLMSLFVMIAIAVAIFIRNNQYETLFKTFEQEPFELTYGVDSVFKQKLEDFRPTYHKRVSLSVAMYLLSPTPLITMSLLGASETVILLMLVTLMFIVGLATYLLIPVVTTFSAYQCVLGEGEYSKEKKEASSRDEEFASFYWPLVTAIYIGWSLWTMAWGYTWIVWPIAGILYASLLGLVNLLSKDKHKPH
jgi:transcriptional regulator with XRE-family HTH domain